MNNRKNSRGVLSAAALIAALAVLAAAPVSAATAKNKKAARKQPAKTLLQNHRAIAAVTAKGGEAPRGGPDGLSTPGRERYENRAYPDAVVTQAQQQAAYLAFQSVAKLPGGKKTNWQEIGPITPFVVDSATYTGRPTLNSGRVTALAISPNCDAIECKIFAAAAGGGIWEADNALAPKPNWHPSSKGLTSNAIGTIIFDPTDPSGKTLYVG